jgi:capsular exopolysaccharide synthesis family protein
MFKKNGREGYLGLMTPQKNVDNDSSKKDERSGFPEALVTIQDPSGTASEAYRMLRTNLIYARGRLGDFDMPPKVIVLTSPGHGEGKSTTVANLGVSLAQAGKHTLILDCDLRRPAQHGIFRARNLIGLVDILVGEQEPQEVWYEPIPNLKLILTGPLPPNPAEILTSRRLTEFLGRVRQEFDYVLVDTPPMGLVSEAAALAANGDGVLLVLDSQHTRKGSLRQALRRLRSVGANVLGTVMNNYETPIGSAAETGYYSAPTTDS